MIGFERHDAHLRHLKSRREQAAQWLESDIE
jgi:hypothetical protein